MSDEFAKPAGARPPERSAKLQKYSAPALEKGLEIMEYLSEQHDPKSMQQIALGVQRSKNEIFRMMIVLEECGYVDRQGTDSFALSDKLYRLALRRPGNKRITDVALPLMDAFTEKNPFSCYLAVPSGLQSVVIAKAESALPIGLSVTLGHQLALDQSAEGLCLLTFMSEARRALVLKRLDYQGAALERLNAQIAVCRAKTQVAMPNDLVPGVEHIAMPIFDALGDNAIAAIGVPYMELKRDGRSRSAIEADLRALTDDINLTISHKGAVTNHG